MKLSALFAGLLVALSVVSGSASAASFTVDSTPSLYEVTGNLAADSKVVFSYASNGASPGSFISAIANETATGITGAANSFSYSAGVIDTHNTTMNISTGILEILTTAALQGTSTITIINNSSSVATFSALFAASRLALAGITTVTGPSATPLPPSAMLFATALLGLLAFGMVRKARNEA